MQTNKIVWNVILKKKKVLKCTKLKHTSTTEPETHKHTKTPNTRTEDILFSSVARPHPFSLTLSSHRWLENPQTPKHSNPPFSSHRWLGLIPSLSLSFYQWLFDFFASDFWVKFKLERLDSAYPSSFQICTLNLFFSLFALCDFCVAQILLIHLVFKLVLKNLIELVFWNFLGY